MADRFCNACGVSLDLHPSEGASDDLTECGVAVRKADLLARMFARPTRDNDGPTDG